MTLRAVVPKGDFEWRGAQKHSLDVIVWYPADPAATERPAGFPQADPLWSMGRAAVDAPVAAKTQRRPLVVLSHGTGGSAAQLAWLGTALARSGIVAAAVDHPGNNGRAPYTPEGFVLRWERSRDLSAVIDGLLADPALGPIVDANRIGAAGFSLGGYTVLELAGGRTDLAAFRRSCADRPRGCEAPPEFPDLVARFEARIASEASVRASMRRAGDSFRDARVRAVFAIAPALASSFTPAGLAPIAVPVQIVVGDADDQAPRETNAAFYEKHIHGAKLDVLPGVGHLTFLDLPTEKGRRERPLLATDRPGVDRAAVHAQVAAMAARFFTEALR